MIRNKEKETAEFVDIESSSGTYGGQVDSFDQLAFQQMQRVLKAGSCEFAGGWWLKVIKKDVEIQRYIEDTRSAFINSVETLLNLLHCYQFSDDQDKKTKEPIAKNQIELWQKKLSDFENKFQTSQKENINLKRDKDEKKELKEQYLNQKAELYRGLFVILSGLVVRNFVNVKGSG